MDKEESEESEDYVDIPVDQQKFTFTYVNSEDLKDEQVYKGIRNKISG